MREKITQRQNELERKSQAIENEHKLNLQQLQVERQGMKEQIKNELNMKFDDFENYQRKLVEVELKEKTLDEKLAKETAEFERHKDSIEKEKKDLESQRLAVRAKEEKFVKIKQEHKVEIAKLES